MYAPVHYVLHSSDYILGFGASRMDPNKVRIWFDEGKPIQIDLRDGIQSDYVATKQNERDGIPSCWVLIGSFKNDYIGKYWKIVKEGSFRTETRRFAKQQNLIIPTGFADVKVEYFTGNICIYAHGKILFKQYFENRVEDFKIKYHPKLGTILFDPGFSDYPDGHARDIVIMKTDPFDPLGPCPNEDQ